MSNSQFPMSKEGIPPFLALVNWQSATRRKRLGRASGTILNISTLVIGYSILLLYGCSVLAAAAGTFPGQQLEVVTFCQSKMAIDDASHP
ncbi:MAG: hypothetical protein JEZ11_25245 [Desulfobacterales bacterium]|nr:hypothetical protein [Desulfobacterales bacterium]